jgi:hypothetical protein
VVVKLFGRTAHWLNTVRVEQSKKCPLKVHQVTLDDVCNHGDRMELVPAMTLGAEAGCMVPSRTGEMSRPVADCVHTDDNLEASIRRIAPRFSLKKIDGPEKKSENIVTESRELSVLAYM